MPAYPETSVSALVLEMRSRADAYLLPDTCQILKPSGTAVKSAKGNLTWADTTELISYNSSTTIPCRFAISRSFRPETTESQEIVASEFTMFFPVGVDLEVGFLIRMTDRNGKVRDFEPRKLSNLGDWDVLSEATVEEIQHQTEPT